MRQHQQRWKQLALSLSLVLSGIAPLHGAWAQSIPLLISPDLFPVLFLETVSEKPSIPTLDGTMPNKLPPRVPETKSVKAFKTEPAQSPVKQLNSGNFAVVKPPEAPHCSYASQLSLTHNQRFRLKLYKRRFVADNKAAFDSLRIKRNLLKHLGKNPASERERQQRDELNAQIRQELQNIKAKKESQIEHVLSPEQMTKLQLLKQQCEAQSHQSTQVVAPNPNAETKPHMTPINSPARQ